MKLRTALEELIRLRGESVLTNKQIENMLSDLNAFEDVPACKYIIRICLSEGLLKFCADRYRNIEYNFIKLQSKLINKYGYRSDVVDYFIENLSGALGLENFCVKKSNVENKQTPQTLDSDNTEHLKFKGIPITGSPYNIMKKLKVFGFRPSPNQNANLQTVYTNGMFSGLENCCVAIKGTSISNTAFTVGVQLPSCSTWNDLKNRYEYYKGKLVKKYGTPHVYENFYAPYCEGDGQELTALLEKKVNFYTYFFVLDGMISVYLQSNYYDGAHVIIQYSDNKGNELAEKENDILADDDL